MTKFSAENKIIENVFLKLIINYTHTFCTIFWQTTEHLC